MKVQEGSFVHVGMELAQEKDSSVTLTQEDFTRNLTPLPTRPALWAGRKKPLATDYIKLRQCKLGELRWVATVSRLEIRAPLARIAPRINALLGIDVYRMSWFEWRRIGKERRC